MEGEAVIESALLLVSGAPLDSRSAPGSSKSGPGAGSRGSSGFSGSVAGRVLVGTGEEGADRVRYEFDVHCPSRQRVGCG
ncbi:uncharacterized protein SAZU_3814 [Streptomyces azureus]|uniref:Uncharacterized protein n=1 Tax=Streptomyces azureus TaxID=146537 RepID=A0A0K8PNF0_STRAJ|nr:uncharacterized protein SAZU_3814 [Streptomyces azureus]